jgi:DNA-binding IclR family transcriptional regulator
MNEAKMTVVKSAARVLDVLELFSGVHGELGVSDVARRLSLPKSSAQGLLTTLAARGYLERVGSSYLLPESLKSERWIGGPRARLIRLAQPVMDRLARDTGESVFLGVITASLEIQYIAKAISTNEVRYDASLDHVRQAYSTTIGLVHLCHMTEEDLDDYFSRVRLRRLAEHTITDESQLRKLALQTRRQGYAELRETNEPGVSGVSAPVYGRDGELIAGLNIGAPTWRFSKVRADLIALAKQRAAELSARLGIGQHAA